MSTCRAWDVVAPYGGSATDPFLDASRYVYLESAMSTLLALARGRLGWLDAFEDGSLTAAGDPDLVSRVAEWFQRSPEHSGATSAGLLRASRRAVRLTGSRRLTPVAMRCPGPLRPGAASARRLQCASWSPRPCLPAPNRRPPQT